MLPPSSTQRCLNSGSAEYRRRPGIQPREYLLLARDADAIGPDRPGVVGDESRASGPRRVNPMNRHRPPGAGDGEFRVGSVVPVSDPPVPLLPHPDTGGAIL